MGSARRKPTIPLPAAIAAAIAVLLTLYLATSGLKEAPPPPVAPGANIPAADEAAAVFEQLASFAATSTHPEAVLQRCQEARPKLRGTRYEPRVEEIEKRAKETRDRSLK